MIEQTAIQKSEPLALYIRKPEVMEKFALVMREDEARRFVQSVILLVQNAEPGEYSLQNCSNESVVKSALRAVTLRVSVDPAERQAWMVPRKNRKSGKLEANLQFHYQEVYNRAMRTNRYQFINVSPVYEDETVVMDVYSGNHRIQLASGLVTEPEHTNRFVPINDRRGKVKGWLGCYKMIRGQEKTVYMSIEDIEEFITRANPFWKSSKAWKDNRVIMEKKTVLLALLRQADTSAPGMEEVKNVLAEIESTEAHDDNGPDLAALSEHDEILEGETSEAPEAQSEPIDPAYAAYLDACEVTRFDGTKYGVIEDDKLQKVIDSQDAPAEKKKAAQIIIDWRKAHPKKSESKLMEELGF